MAAEDPMTSATCSACGAPLIPRSGLLWTCTECGSGRRWPPKPRRELSEIYTAAYFSQQDRAHGYFDLARLRSWKKLTAELLLRRVWGELPPRRPLFALDFGAGTGEVAHVCARRGMTTVAVEPNPVGRSLAAQMGTQTAEDIDRLDPDWRFDVTFLCDVVEHLEDPRQTLVGLKKRVARDALLVITTPNFSGPWRKVLRSRWPHLKLEEHLHYFSPSGITRLLSRAGWSLLWVRPHLKLIALDYLLRDQNRRGGTIGRLANRAAAVSRKVLPFPIPAYLDEMLVVARNTTETKD